MGRETLTQSRPPSCLSTVHQGCPSHLLPSASGRRQKSHTAVILSVCVLDLCCQVNISSSHFVQSRAVQSDCFRLFFFTSFSSLSVFCLYNVELKKLSEFYCKKGKSPVQRAVSLAQRAAVGGNAQPASRSPAGSAYLILFLVCFISKHPHSSPMEEHRIHWIFFFKGTL